MVSDLAPGAGILFILVPVLLYVALTALALFVFYLIVRTAVLRALHSHYKSVRMFEETGEWMPRYSGRSKPPSRGR